MVDTLEFRTAMSKFATGVTVVTTLDPEGVPHAMTANAFTSVCLDPPTLLVCVAHNTITYGYVEAQQRIGVNVLREEQEELGQYFARRPEQREGDPDYSYTIGDHGVPALDGSMVFFNCDIVGAHVYGDHTIYVGEVKAMVRNDQDANPLMFFDSHWYHPGH